MGTHPNAPSKLFETGEDLGAFLKSKPSLMNEECFKVYGDLPFLFKVCFFVLKIFCCCY